MIARDRDAPEVNARLTAAAESGETLELILVVRGKVRPARGSGRWRIRVEGPHVLTFGADAVLAATPVAVRDRRTRS